MDQMIKNALWYRGELIKAEAQVKELEATREEFQNDYCKQMGQATYDYYYVLYKNKIKEFDEKIAELKAEVKRLGNITVGDTDSFKISKMNLELQTQLNKEREKRKEAEYDVECLRALRNKEECYKETRRQAMRAEKAVARVRELEDSHDKLSKVLSKATLVETNDKIKELEAEVERLKARETYLENLGTARFKDMHKVQAKLLKTAEALQELKHQNHHTIEEEMWRIDKVLKDLEEQ